jgi:hypothetical protein
LHRPKIPDICWEYGIEVIKIADLIERGLEFLRAGDNGGAKGIDKPGPID